MRRSAVGVRIALGVIAAVSSGCLSFEMSVFQPVVTDEYVFPDNRIPAAQLEEVAFDSPGGVRLAAAWATQLEPAAAPTVLFFHGQAGNIDHAWRKVMNIWESGFNVLAVDYRGYGKSTGDPSEAGLYADAGAAWHYLLERGDVDPERIVIWGFSLGTGVASWLAVEVTPAALMLEAPFTSMKAMIENASPYEIPSDWVSNAKFRTLERIDEVHGGVVVAHGTDDRRIPYWMGEKVYDAAPEPKRLVRIEGGRHDNLLKKARAEIVEALVEVSPATAP